MKVQIIGHNGVGRGSRVIKWATRGRFSHVSLRFIFESKEELGIISGVFDTELTMDHEIESIQFKGVHHRPFVQSNNQGWFDFDQTPYQSMMILATAVELIGSKYDWIGIYSFATRKNKESKSKWFCSELVAWCLMRSGIYLMMMPCHWITPNIGCASPILTEVRSPKSQ